MAKGKPRHKNLPLDERMLKNHEMFLRRNYGEEMSDEDKDKYLNKIRESLKK